MHEEKKSFQSTETRTVPTMHAAFLPCSAIYAVAALNGRSFYHCQKFLTGKTCLLCLPTNRANRYYIGHWVSAGEVRSTVAKVLQFYKARNSSESRFMCLLILTLLPFIHSHFGAAFSGHNRFTTMPMLLNGTSQSVITID